ncbi:MAG: hypothetical protein V4773_19110 [Verrucomicrobiota bacterium]
MSRVKDILLAGLTLSAGVLAFVVWRQHGEIKRLAARAERDFAVVPSAETMTLRLAANRSVAVPGATSSSQRRGSVNESDGFEASGLTGPRASRKRGGALTRLLENPEFVRALNLQRHAMLDTRFADLFRRLNLEGDELAEFKRLLVEKENVALDVVAVSESAPEGPLRPETMQAGIRAAQLQIEQAIHSSLGSDRYAVYRDYERTLMHRATVAQLEQRLSYTSTPLTPSQADAVVRILDSNTPPASVENSAPPVSVLVRSGVPEAVPIGPTTAGTGRVTDQVVAQSQTVLTPAQLGALKQIQEEQQAAMKAAQMIRDVAPAATDMVPTIPGLWLN